jgi:hypothetical protein
MVLAIGAIVGLTDVGWNDLLPSEYIQQMGHPVDWGQADVEIPLALRIVDSIEEYLTGYVRETVLPGGASSLLAASAVGLLVSGLVVLGITRWAVRAGLPLSVLFAVIYFVTVLPWPWRGPRFLYPIQPQLLFGLLLGLEAVFYWFAKWCGKSALPRRFASGFWVLGIALMVALCIYKDASSEDNRLHVGDLAARSSWVKANTPSGSVLMTEQPQLDFLYSERRTVPYGGFLSSRDLEQYLTGRGVDYILIAPELVWQPVYTPHLSRTTEQVVSLTSELVAEHKAEQVYSSEREQVKVFKVWH